jgi:hypothetical protein
MSMAKQIFYHNLRKGNKAEVEIYNRDIKPYIEIYQKRKQTMVIRFTNTLKKRARLLQR